MEGNVKYAFKKTQPQTGGVTTAAQKAKELRATNPFILGCSCSKTVTSMSQHLTYFLAH